METIGGQGKALATSHAASPQMRASSKIQRALDERMSLSEAIEAAGAIVDCYPNGGASASRGYIGALAAVLATYPKQVAKRCSDRVQGVSRECKFLPTIADIVAWCERETEPLRRQVDYEKRIATQLSEREEFLKLETQVRPARLTMEELKEKYGDWKDNWRSPGTRARELYEQARADLIAQIGEAAFNALPEAAE